MACKQDKKIISRFLDGTLNDNEASLIKDHLKGCPECREFYDQAKAVMSMIDPAEHVTPPPYLYTRIRRDIESLDREPFFIKWLRPVLVPALAVATLVLFGLGSTLLFRSLANQTGTRSATSGADLNLQVFKDAPQSSLAQAYAQITGDRK
jgi:predicted anti-sigma-YlaC factor YlaD